MVAFRSSPRRRVVITGVAAAVASAASEDPLRTDADLIDLALATTTLEPAAWDARYRD